MILIGFALLTSCGAGESAAVSMVMFVGHTTVLILLIIWGFAYGIQDNFQIFRDNLHTDYPTIISSSGQVIGSNSGIASIFCGYSIGLLGITGFETPANYVEEMKNSKVLLSVINWMW